MMEELRKNIVVFCEKYEAYFNTKRVLENTKHEIRSRKKYEIRFVYMSYFYASYFKTTHIYCH